MLPTLLARVQSILEFIHQRPLTPQLVTFLTQNFCPNGEICGVTVSHLSNDGTLICEIAQGFTKNEKLIGLAASISSDGPGAEALVKLRTLVLTRADAVGRFKDFVSQDFMDDFHSAVIMPVGLRTIYGFALQVDSTKIEGFVEYSECLRSLLLFHEETSSGSRGANAMSNTRRAPRDLTD